MGNVVKDAINIDVNRANASLKRIRNEIGKLENIVNSKYPSAIETLRWGWTSEASEKYIASVCNKEMEEVKAVIKRLNVVANAIEGKIKEVQDI